MLGHVYRNHDLIYIFIYSFHLPLFFIISGYFFNHDKYKSIKELLKSKLGGLILPYFFFYLATYLYWVLIESKFRSGAGGISLEWWRPLIGLFYGDNLNNFMGHNTPLWFIPTLISVEVFCYSLYKFKSILYRCICLGIITIAGYFFVSKGGFLLPWGISHALLALIFYFSGRYIRNIHDFSLKQKLIAFVLMLVFYLAVMFRHIPDVDMFVMRFENPGLFILYAFYTSVLVLLLCDLFSLLFTNSKVVAATTFFGINSLIVLCIHDPVKRMIIYIYSKGVMIPIAEVRDSIFHSLAITFILMILLLPIIFVYNRTLKPWFSGLIRR